MSRYQVSDPTVCCLKKRREETKGNTPADIAHFSMAYAELYLTISRIVRSFTMDLYETTLKDIEIHHIRLVGFPRTVKGQGTGRGKIRVKVTGKTE